jgi:chemotaxis protein methyltransferase CheR
VIPRIADHELPLVADYVHRVSGIVIEPAKAYLVESRLGPMLERERASTYLELVALAQRDASGTLCTRIIDAITTNETSFFRDARPFELLAHKLVPDLLERQMGATRPRIDIWSAAASTGQEVYSIAMVLEELLFDTGRYGIRILGTDISDATLARASRGRYSEYELSRGLDSRRKERFFQPVDRDWQIKDRLRALATFRPLNLLARFRHVGTYDIIFCRNVAIYFSPQNRLSLFDRLVDQLRPGGVLIIGSTESLIGVTRRLERQSFHGAVYYRRVR